MKRILIVLFAAINSSLLFGQTTLINEGIIVNNSLAGDWGGVNIPRAVPTSFTFRNNSITSVNSSGYMLQAGDEGIGSTNNMLAGEIISGNKFIWNGTDMTSITHGIFTGHNQDVIIEYNYLNKVPMGIIRKSANKLSNITGGVAYNVVISPAVAVVVKGMSNVNIYNNTFYQTRTYAETVRGLIDIYTNTDVSPTSYAHGTKIKNNIFYTKYQTTNIRILDNDCLTDFECDYNLYWCEVGSPRFEVNGAIITFAQWQALGYDTHSVVINPNFISFTDFVPTARLDYGTNLSATWEVGLSTAALWTLGVSPATAKQNGTWQVGARVYESASASVNPSYINSVVENATPSLVQMTFNLSLAAIVPSVSAFNVQVNSISTTVNSVAISGDKVQLTLGSALKYGDIVTLGYTKPATNPLQTIAGGIALSIAAQPVINNIVSSPVVVLPVTIKMIISPNHVHKIMNILLEYTGSLTNQSSALTPEIIKVTDLSGGLFIEQLIVTGATNIKIPVNLHSGVYNVLLSAGGQDMITQKMFVY